MLRIAAATAAILLATVANAAPADHYSPAKLEDAAKALIAKAAGNGSASVTLQQYPNHFTMLSYRSKDGGAEVHTQIADIFYVLRGKATLLTEGTVDNSSEERPGEFRGTAITGGKSQVLLPGDVVHIPAGTPHQLLVAKGDEVLYFVVKVQEHK